MVVHLVLGMVYWTLLPVAFLADLLAEFLLAADVRRWAVLPLALVLSVCFTLVATLLLHWAVAVAVAGAEVFGIEMSTLPIFRIPYCLEFLSCTLVPCCLKGSISVDFSFNPDHLSSG